MKEQPQEKRKKDNAEREGTFEKDLRAGALCEEKTGQRLGGEKPSGGDGESKKSRN